ncbi:MAG: VOC family protein [Candidatus Dormibacteria bacterium]
MTSRVVDVIVDSQRPLELANWWAEVLGYRVHPQAAQGWVAIAPWPSSDERPSDEETRRAPQVPQIVFVPVPESKRMKNRVHLDLWAIDRTQEEEVAALQARGARRVDIGQGEQPWVVMADPEGNEFCVL